MVSSGFLVNTIPGKTDLVQNDIRTIPNAEINSIIDDSKLAIIVCVRSMEEKKALVKKIEKIDGVISVNLTFDHFEEGDTNGSNA
jgi:nitrate reductase NapD